MYCQHIFIIIKDNSLPNASAGFEICGGGSAAGRMKVYDKAMRVFHQEGNGMIYEAIRNLVQYGLNTGLLEKEDELYARNQILRELGLDEYEEPCKEAGEVSLEKTLKELLDYAAENGILENNSVVYRDLFDTKLMNCLM